MTATEPAEADAHALVGLLADPGRLRVVACLALGSTRVGEVVERSGLEEGVVLRALDRLTRSGLVQRGPTGLHLLEGLFSAAARQHSAQLRAAEPSPESLGASPAQSAVLRHFLHLGRLTHLPASAGKRQVVLDFLAGRFEPGRRYTEAEVNRELGHFHEDVATLRRYLVDAGLMDREAGFYWRSGGTVGLE